jgi:hypothetical protein
VRRRAARIALGALFALAFAPAAGAAPLGDGLITSSAPAPARAYSCTALTRDRTRDPPWIAGGRFDPARVPRIDGSVAWPDASFTIRRRGSTASFAGNALPVDSRTGVFPVLASDDAARYAGDQAVLRPQRLSGAVPRKPRAGRPRCISARRPVGVGLDGVPIMPPFTPAGRDAVAREVADACGGSSDSLGRYHYRAAIPCVARDARGAHSRQVGWARDGFAIFGPRGADGLRLRSSDLDACHGHTHRVVIGGVARTVYHYHLTGDFPYTLGCFRGSPSNDWRSVPAPRLDVFSEPRPAPPETPTPTPTPPTPPTPPTGPDERGAVRIATTPALVPAFDPATSDYVVRCDDAPVQVQVDAPASVDTAIDRAAAVPGSHSAAVSLAANQAFAVTAANSYGTREYHVRCLPPDFPNYVAERAGTPQAQWYVVTPVGLNTVPGYAAVFDANGTPVWWLNNAWRAIDAKVIGDEIVWATFNDAGELVWMFRRFDGTLTRSLSTVGIAPDLHDIQRMPNGNYLVLAYKPRDGVDLRPWGPDNATVLDAEVQEVTPAGALVWSWNSKDHIDVSETGHWYSDGVIDQPTVLADGRSAYDIIHMNSLEPDGDGVIMSMRHTDGVYRVRRSDGKIDWKLGGTHVDEESLTVVDDPHGDNPLSGQHDARVTGPDTISIHDNGTKAFRAPRAVRYRIDPALRTATLLEQVTDPRAPSAFCCGSARRLSGGDWVASWGAQPLFTELAPDGTPLLTVRFPDGEFSYRAAPLEPGAVAAPSLRAGMDTMHPR